MSVDQEKAELLAENARLKLALNRANALAEQFERGWYLRGDALERLQQWAQAYPLSVFPEPDLGRAHEVLSAAGMTLDAISASNMRHVIMQTIEIVQAGLKEPQDLTDDGQPGAVEIDYTNWKGERGKRVIVPYSIRWGANSYHQEAQFLLCAMDVGKQALRDFAMQDIHGWTPVPSKNAC